MDYKTLLEKYRTKEVFIYGKSVVQLVDKQTYVDDGVKKTDFEYHTDRHRRGLITVINDDQNFQTFAI